MEISGVLQDVLDGKSKRVILSKVILDLLGDKAKEGFDKILTNNVELQYKKVISAAINEITRNYNLFQFPDDKTREAFASDLSGRIETSILESVIDNNVVHQALVKALREYRIHKKGNEISDIKIKILSTIEKKIKKDENLSKIVSYKLAKQDHDLLNFLKNISIEYENSFISLGEQIKKIQETAEDTNGKLYDLIENPINQHTDDLKELLPSFNEWNEFWEISNHFREENNFILLIDENTQSLNKVQKKAILSLPWKMIIDMDMHSKTDGLNSIIDTKSMADYLQLTHLDINSLMLSKDSEKTIWLYGCGLTERQDTIFDKQQNWRREAFKTFQRFFKDFFKKFPSKPIITVCSNKKNDFIRSLLELIDEQVGDNGKYVYIHGNESIFNYYSSFCNGIRIDISLEDLCASILRYEKVLGISAKTQDDIIIPTNNEKTVVISVNEYKNMLDDFYVIHQNIADENSRNANEKELFLKGREISWFNLKCHHDIDRDDTDKFKKRILDALHNGVVDDEKNIFYVQHKPGAGGTTIGKRLAWDIHQDYPVIIMKNYRGRRTADSILNLYKTTMRSILIVVENNIIGDDNLALLINDMKSLTIPHTFLIISRIRTQKVTNKSARTYYLNVLTDNEYEILKLNCYDDYLNNFPKIEKEKKEKQIQRIISNKRYEELNPFFIGLICFEKEFSGIDEYLDKYLVETKTEIQRSILFYIAMCYKYTGKSVPDFLFNRMVSLETNQTIRLEKYFPDFDFQSLFVCEEKNKIKFWRPRHYIIAEKLFKKILSQGMENPDDWKYALGSKAVKFIEDTCCTKNDEYTMDILKLLFVMHDDNDFSGLIIDIPGIDQQLEIFNNLTQYYPNEAHFWAQKARFYYSKDKNNDKAIECAEKAIDTQDNGNENSDAVLLHVWGMAIRGKLYDQFEFHKTNKDRNPKYILNIQDFENIKYLMQEASERFEDARNVRTKTKRQDSYTANVQMIIKLVDFGCKMAGVPFIDFIQKEESRWYISYMDIAECLMSDMQKNSANGNNIKDQSFIEDCQNQILTLQGNISQVLQNWNIVLEKLKGKTFDRSYACAVRRQIARIYLNKDVNDIKNINRVIELMEENIAHEPDNAHNIQYWFNAVRYTHHISIDSAIAKLSVWYHSRENDIEVCYYLYILKILKALSGSSEAVASAHDFIRKTFEIAMILNLGNRTSCFEWLGKGTGIDQLISNKTKHIMEEKDDKFQLAKIDGMFTKYEHRGKGVIEFKGIPVFFKPHISGLTDGDINKPVSFSVGFTYDGLRAEDKSVILK